MDKLYRPPSIGALQALSLVAESDNFTEAAEKLHLTQSAVSRKIQQLESHYGVPLFARNSRSVQLTEHGEAVLEVARKILRELQMLDERISPRDRPFRIRIFVSLAVRWLLPRLTRFYAQHPDLSLSIETVATELVDPSGNCDAYILYLPEPPDDPAFITLFDEVLVPVCAPVCRQRQAASNVFGRVGAVHAHSRFHRPARMGNVVEGPRRIGCQEL